MGNNKAAIKETLAALGPMGYGPLEEASGVPSGAFGWALRELVVAGEVERDDRDYQLPSADTEIRAYCAACGDSHPKVRGRMDLTECTAA